MLADVKRALSAWKAERGFYIDAQGGASLKISCQQVFTATCEAEIKALRAKIHVAPKGAKNILVRSTLSILEPQAL